MKYYYLINGKIMSANEKMPDKPCYKVLWDSEGDEIWNDWHSSLQPCEISEDELGKVMYSLGWKSCDTTPIEVTDIISDNNGVITFKQPKQVEEIEADCKQHIYDWEWYQPLFDLMLTHNVKLLEGEMDEIINCVNKMNASNRNI